MGYFFSKKTSSGRSNFRHTPNSKIDLGAAGERLAIEFLRRKGLHILYRNWRVNQGEIDIIALDGRDLVFVEVKTRIYSPFAERHIYSNITEKKKKKLRQLVSLFLSRHYYSRNSKSCSSRTGMSNRGVPPHRIDIVGVLLDEKDKSNFKIQHLIGAIEADDRS